MIYRAINPRQGYPARATRAELLRSNHREVREAAARMRPVVINGVKYLPVVSDQKPVGRSRVTSLPGFEISSAESLAVARQVVAAQSAVSLSPVPQHIAELGSTRIAIPSLMPVRLAPTRRIAPYLTFAALLWLSAGIGFAWLALRSASEPQYAAPHYDRRVGQ